MGLKETCARQADEIVRLKSCLDKEQTASATLLAQREKAYRESRAMRELLEESMALSESERVRILNFHYVLREQIGSARVAVGDVGLRNPTHVTGRFLDYLANGIETDREIVERVPKLIERIRAAIADQDARSKLVKP